MALKCPVTPEEPRSPSALLLVPAPRADTDLHALAALLGPATHFILLPCPLHADAQFGLGPERRASACRRARRPGSAPCAMIRPALPAHIEGQPDPPPPWPRARAAASPRRPSASHDPSLAERQRRSSSHVPPLAERRRRSASHDPPRAERRRRSARHAPSLAERRRRSASHALGSWNVRHDTSRHESTQPMLHRAASCPRLGSSRSTR
jgi:hypothetical protein